MRTLRRDLRHADAEIDLVPMIDCIFLMLLFFMLCGRISMEDHPEQITVPPGKTARIASSEWPRQVVNIQSSSDGNVITLGGRRYATDAGAGSGSGDWQALRGQLDLIYDRADRYPDPKQAQLMLPRVIVEIRADADASYRTIMELEQVLADTDATGAAKTVRRPFVDIDYAVREVGR